MKTQTKTNSFDINIPEYLNSHYPKWTDKNPEICQLGEDLNCIKVWKNKQEITKFFGARVQGLDLALRNSCRFKGFFWVVKVLYDEGLRPEPTAKRNDKIYAYNPSKELLERYNNYEFIDPNSFYKEGVRETFQFIGRFKNSVAVSMALDLSITNIRRVAKKDPDIIFHKDYFFSFEPLLRINKVVAEIIDLSSYNERGVLDEKEKELLYDYIKEFKETYFETKREIGFVEEQLYKILTKDD